MYRLHSYTVDYFINEFSSFLDNVTAKNLIIIGDLNINILSDSNDSNNYLSMMSSFGLASLVNEITRAFSSSCIDHLFVRQGLNNNHKINSIVFDFEVTDHASIIFSINDNPKININAERIDYVSVDYNRLSDSLSNERWLSVYDADCVEKAYYNFTALLNSHIQNCQYTISKPKTKKLKPWITSELSNEIKKKINLYRKHKTHPQNKKLATAYK